MSTRTPSATDVALRWSRRADSLQGAILPQFRGGVLALAPGLLRNTSVPRFRDHFTFNYWWHAHAVDVRLDAFARTGAAGSLEQAENIYAGIRRRNGGTFVNHYFDDMAWLALAAVRLFDATRDERYLSDAQALWMHAVDFGWNDTAGASLAWRTQQLYYKNAPSNGAFGILSARLFGRTGEQRHLHFAESSLDWFERTLVDANTGFVADGINREQNNGLDSSWRFSYNQGLYLGLLVESSARNQSREPLERALRTAQTTFDLLAPDGVFRSENTDAASVGGGDIGLFKGIFLRYLADLLLQLDARGADSSDASARRLSALVAASTDALWLNRDPATLLVADDWSHGPSGVAFLSTQLGAVMAVEARARLESRLAGF